ncbi:GAF domain-containing protein, partial [Streptomyces sp. MK7]
AAQAEVLKLIAERAREITGAALAAMSTPVKDTDTLTVELAIGQQAEAHRGLVLPVDGTLTGEAFTSGAPVSSPDIAHDTRVTAGPPRFAGLGPAVAVPVGAGGQVRGVVLLARGTGAGNFSDTELELLKS